MRITMRELIELMTLAYGEGVSAATFSQTNAPYYKDEAAGHKWKRIMELAEIPNACLEPAIGDDDSVMDLLAQVWRIQLRRQ